MDSNVTAGIVFEQNLFLLEQKDFSLAYLLKQMKHSISQRKIDGFLSRQEDNFLYHNPQSLTQEVDEWFKSLDLSHATAIFVYGIDLRYYQKIVNEWLHKCKKRALIFFEDDISTLHRLCEIQEAKSLLQDSQVEIIFLNDFLSNKTIFDRLALKYIKEPVLITSLFSYLQKKEMRFDDIKQGLTYEFELKNSLLSEYLHFGDVFYRNFYLNLPSLPQSYLGNALFQKFKDVPAIICGAGPSLNKNIDLLAQLKERCLVFSGGTALCALSENGIIPHFGVAIDPHPYQHSRLLSVQKYDIPFFYKNRLFHDALNAIKGMKVYMPGASGYALSEWFEEELGIHGEILEEGHNVVNFSLQIAHALGCNPLILVGVDCAYTGNETYANKVDSYLSEDEIIHSSKTKLIRKDIFGAPAMTEWKWVSEADWIATFARKHPEDLIINATEGGLGFDDISNTSLEEVSKQWLDKKRLDYEGAMKELESHSLSGIDPNRILELMSQLKESLVRCLDLLNSLIDICQKAVEETHMIYLSQKIFYDMELEEEVAYKAILNDFTRAFKWSHQREENENLKYETPDLLRERSQFELEKKHYAFLRDVVQHHLHILERHLYRS